MLCDWAASHKCKWEKVTVEQKLSEQNVGGGVLLHTSAKSSLWKKKLAEYNNTEQKLNCKKVIAEYKVESQLVE